MVLTRACVGVACARVGLALAGVKGYAEDESERVMPQNLKKRNPETIKMRIDALVSGLLHLQRPILMNIEGKNLAIPDLAGVLRQKKQPYTKVDDQHTAWKQAIQDRDAAQPGTLRFLDSAEAAIGGALGPSSPELILFGIKPKRERRPMTPEERVARANALRTARSLRKAALEAARRASGASS